MSFGLILLINWLTVYQIISSLVLLTSFYHYHHISIVIYSLFPVTQPGLIIITTYEHLFDFHKKNTWI